MAKSTLLIGAALSCACTGVLSVGADPDPQDSGMRRMDAGPRRDAGPRPDSGPNRVDGGPNPVDGGPSPIDGGPEPDTGPVPDSGPPPDPCDPAVLPELDYVQVGSGLEQPIYVTQPPGVTDALYAVEKWGRIVIVRGGVVDGTFLDIRDIVSGPDHTVPSDGEERGLLGLAFHPDYEANGRFFVYYAPFGRADGEGLAYERRVLLEEYRRSVGDPEVADATPVRSFFEDGMDPPGLADPAGNHNGGMIEFWPRTGGGPYYLYVAMGDGGGGCDGDNNAQDLASPWGKMHRLDVDGASPFAAPGNPFDDTIWQLGLRNPWRFSFDRETGDLFIGDVGQGAYEEISYAPGSSTGGENFGWRPLEGNCGSAASGCSSDFDDTCLTSAEQIAEGFTPPLHATPRSGGGIFPFVSAHVGGYVYRGAAIPELRGWYLFGDYGASTRAALRVCDGVESDYQGVPDLSGSEGVASFGEDNAGELYMVFQRAGTIQQIVAP
jgi:glucose/arabinose dehydrogenase